MRTIAPLINVGLGAVMIYMGVTGRGALVGTDSTIALTAVGAVVAAWGIFRVIQEARRDVR
jgi:hypothetical protein